MLFETNKDKGRAGMALGIAYYGANGYTVSAPLNDTQWYDFIIEKDGIFQTVQCKATGSSNNEVSLRSSGGTKGIPYDWVKNHEIDYLFCVDKDMNMYSIPGKVIKEEGLNRSIVLRTEPTKNGQGFQTYKYLVYI